MPQVADLTEFLSRFAPLDLAEEWDNVGLLVGDRSREVTRVLTCLTLTPDVAREAIDERVGLVLTHHPVLFRPIQRLSADDPQGKMLLELIAAGVAVYSPHTGYDNAPRGINQQLAELLGLADIGPLRPVAAPACCKIVCFVPREHLAAVQQVLWSAGAGIVGDYSNCSFVIEGTGSFFGSDAAHPAVGAAGRLESVAEARLEITCPERLVPEAINRLRAAHPYEEPAIDVYPLKELISKRGVGRVGTFSLDVPGQTLTGRAARLTDLLSRIKTKLELPYFQFVSEENREVSRVGVCCGSGGELLPAAIAAGCDAFVTGEARFHTCLEARTAGIALVLAGHYATERPAMEHLASVIQGEFPGIASWASRVERDPVKFARELDLPASGGRKPPEAPACSVAPA
ncbi:MAG: Nif3-like dinuclear metal center hexameric protein [Planctomycetaceae bacterium]|nr:Nif3-like dinuclear metal center hexameric protein [Planctomycetaceae bacterium]